MIIQLSYIFFIFLLLHNDMFPSFSAKKVIPANSFGSDNTFNLVGEHLSNYTLFAS